MVQFLWSIMPTYLSVSPLSCLPVLSPLLRSPRPGRDARRHRFTIVSIPLSRPGVFLFSLRTSYFWDISTELKKMSFPLLYVYIYIYVYIYTHMAKVLIILITV